MLLLAGMSLSASAATMLNESVIGWSNISDSLSQDSADFGTGKTNTTVAVSGDFMTITNTTDYLAGPVSSAHGSTVAFVLNLDKFTSDSFQLIAGYYYGSSVAYWGGGLSSDKKIQGTWGSATEAWNSAALSTDSLSGKVYATLSHSVSGTTIQYQLENSTETISVNNAGLRSTSGSTQLSKVSISNELITSGVIEQLYLFNTDNDANASDIISSMKSVPEPATASLSLLGLVALMMRRRRA